MAKRYDNNDDIVGQRFGKLVVKEFLERDTDYRKWYLCECDCGKEVRIRRDALLSGHTKTCGDCSMIIRENDYYRYYCHTGGSFIFDPCDLEFVKSYKWFINSNNGYVRTSVAGHMEEFTRLIYDNIGANKVVDHINGCRNDNRRSNLRLVTISQNSQNKAMSSGNSTGYKGVSIDNSRKKPRFRAQIIKNQIKYHIGLFDCAEDAARAYDMMARQLHGEFACVNFPLPGEQGCRERVAV